eukprot:TRINITY_DN38771_c0_g2_i6.p2 TRINITY_DN38771_c0_g2~~TRINITY_DN38771_c0_g2_i6.p2  ORF type:complete len:167 (-),score=13.06 TRINITY_DN38771_c0_g2_i6:108-608(-)
MQPPWLGPTVLPPPPPPAFLAAPPSNSIGCGQGGSRSSGGAAACHPLFGGEPAAPTWPPRPCQGCCHTWKSQFRRTGPDLHLRKAPRARSRYGVIVVALWLQPTLRHVKSQYGVIVDALWLQLALRHERSLFGRIGGTSLSGRINAARMLHGWQRSEASLVHCLAF